MNLSDRRQQHWEKLHAEDGNVEHTRVADWEYRRDISNDVEQVLRDAGVFEPLRLPSWEPDGKTDPDRDRELRKLADDIAAYIVN